MSKIKIAFIQILYSNYEISIITNVIDSYLNLRFLVY